jgi:YHS domain-containing protein
MARNRGTLGFEVRVLRAMLKRRSLWTVLVLSALGGSPFSSGAVSAEPKLPNEFCPVMKNKKAQAEFSTIHGGRTIHFCCDNCLEAFKATPQAFLANLPPAPKLTGHNHPAGWRPPGLGGDDSTSPGGFDQGGAGHGFVALAFNSRTLGALRWLAAAVLPMLVFLRYRERRRPTVSVPLWVTLAKGGAVVAGVLVFLGLVWRIVTLQTRIEQLEEVVTASGSQLSELRLLQNVHYATFLDFGKPPVPVRPPLPKRLAGTFYRGNDERDPGLFNGGNYRTATFQVSVRQEDGKDAEYGQDLGSSPLFIRLEIERGPNTPDFFWAPERMNTMFLTQETDPALGAKGPIADRVGLTALAPLRLWEALYPIGPAPAGEASRSGIVYVREKMRGGSRFHYGIPYELHFRNGRLTRDSDVFMGALYRTRKVLPSKLPLHEWFSHNPIPTLPAPREADAQTLQADVDPGTGRQ